MGRQSEIPQNADNIFYPCHVVFPGWLLHVFQGIDFPQRLVLTLAEFMELQHLHLPGHEPEFLDNEPSRLQKIKGFVAKPYIKGRLLHAIRKAITSSPSWIAEAGTKIS